MNQVSVFTQCGVSELSLRPCILSGHVILDESTHLPRLSIPRWQPEVGHIILGRTSWRQSGGDPLGTLPAEPTEEDVTEADEGGHGTRVPCLPRFSVPQCVPDLSPWSGLCPHCLEHSSSRRGKASQSISCGDRLSEVRGLHSKPLLAKVQEAGEAKMETWVDPTLPGKGFPAGGRPPSRCALSAEGRRKARSLGLRQEHPLQGLHFHEYHPLISRRPRLCLRGWLSTCDLRRHMCFLHSCAEVSEFHSQIKMCQSPWSLRRRGAFLP